jgi:hypothetical protein
VGESYELTQVREPANVTGKSSALEMFLAKSFSIDTTNLHSARSAALEFLSEFEKKFSAPNGDGVKVLARFTLGQGS